MRKLQIQSSKFQRNSNLQSLNRSARVSAACFWNSGLGVSLGFGSWELGISPGARRHEPDRAWLDLIQMLHRCFNRCDRVRSRALGVTA